MCGNFNGAVQNRAAERIGKPAAAAEIRGAARPVPQDKNIDLYNGDREEKENTGAVITPQAALSYDELAGISVNRKSINDSEKEAASQKVTVRTVATEKTERAR